MKTQNTPLRLTKKNNWFQIKKTIVTLLLILFASFIEGQVGTWTQVATDAPHVNCGTALLLTDGSVIVVSSAPGLPRGKLWD